MNAHSSGTSQCAECEWMRMDARHAVDHDHHHAGEDRHHQHQVEIARWAGVVPVDDVEPLPAPAVVGGGSELGIGEGAHPRIVPQAGECARMRVLPPLL
ncbi:hypothetical protein FHR59_003755 [Xanthomonas arboricola]|nr:hypothetical protein [Xanthomonas arboricola]